MNNTIEETEITTLFTEMREETNREKSKTQVKPEAKKFEVLPDGDYVGRVYILTDTVANQGSPNYGRKKYELRLTVTEGNYKGKMAYHHRVILPHTLANKPSANDRNALTLWQIEVKKYLRKTDEILSNCGVDTSDTEMNRFVMKIAENNRRNPRVHFTMKNGVPYINHFVGKDPATDESDSLFTNETLPTGNDAPIQ